MVYGAIEGHSNGANINTWRAIKDSKLTALSINGDKLIQTVTVADVTNGPSVVEEPDQLNKSEDEIKEGGDVK